MKELLIIGFAEKHRALEVLPQLQRLHFDWRGDLQNAVAVEVERDGGLKLFHGLPLESETSTGDSLDGGVSSARSTLRPIGRIRVTGAPNRSALRRQIDLRNQA